MDWPTQCAAVIPCLNEARTIATIVQKVRSYLPHVLVIDDGSTDGTAPAARDAGATLIRHEKPKGKGAALRAAWAWASQNGFEWVLALDGDGQHEPADVPKFFQCAENTSATLIIGNRMEAASEMPFLRRHVNAWMSRKLSRLAGTPLPDSQCGFRLARVDLLMCLPLTAANFEIESEQVLAFAAAGQQIRFVPISVIYRREQSKIHPLRDMLRWFQWLSRWRASCERRE